MVAPTRLIKDAAAVNGGGLVRGRGGDAGRRALGYLRVRRGFTALVQSQ